MLEQLYYAVLAMYGACKSFMLQKVMYSDYVYTSYCYHSNDVQKVTKFLLEIYILYSLKF